MGKLSEKSSMEGLSLNFVLPGFCEDCEAEFVFVVDLYYLFT